MVWEEFLLKICGNRVIKKRRVEKKLYRKNKKKKIRKNLLKRINQLKIKKKMRQNKVKNKNLVFNNILFSNKR